MKTMLEFILVILFLAIIFFTLYAENSTRKEELPVHQDYFAIIYAPYDIKNIGLSKGDKTVVNFMIDDDSYIIRQSLWGLPYFENNKYDFIEFVDSHKKNIEINSRQNWTSNNVKIDKKKYRLLSGIYSGSKAVDTIFEIYRIKDNKFFHEYQFRITDKTMYNNKYITNCKEYLYIYQPQKFNFQNGFGKLYPINKLNNKIDGGNILLNIYALFKCDLRFKTIYSVLILTMLASLVLFKYYSKKTKGEFSCFSRKEGSLLS